MVSIILVCAGGMSSSFLVQNMRQAIKQNGIDAAVSACGKARLEDIISQCDVILIAPQALFYEERIRELCASRGKVYGLISPTAYGRMDGAAVLEQALALFNTQEGSMN